MQRSCKLKIKSKEQITPLRKKQKQRNKKKTIILGKNETILYCQYRKAKRCCFPISKEMLVLQKNEHW